MPQIIFVQPDGARLALATAGEATVMHLAVRHDVAGLPAECGGQLVCASCMVDVAAEWATRVGPPGEDERDMIEDSLGRVPEGRRLCCRIAVTEALDGLVLHVPPTQG
jgi:2Fe-2S ferredoxin